MEPSRCESNTREIFRHRKNYDKKLNNNINVSKLVNNFDVVENIELTELDFISSPYLAGSLYHGAKSITVYGFLLDVTLDIEVDSEIISSIVIQYPHPDGVLVDLPEKLIKDQQVRVRQRTDELKSEWSDFIKVVDVKKDYAIVLPRPKINSQLYECSSRTFISNLIQGGNVKILNDDYTIGYFIGCKQKQPINLNTSPINDQKIRAESEIIGLNGYPSLEHNVNPVPKNLEPPIMSPLYENSRYVLIQKVIDGATINLTRNNSNVIHSFECGSNECFIPLETPLQVGEEITVWQSMCSDAAITSYKTNSLVLSCDSIPLPKIGPIQIGDDSILLTDYIYGATIIVYLNKIQVGKGGGPKIPLNKKIEYNDIIHIQQIVGNCKGKNVLQIKPLCVNPPITDDPSELDFYPVGTSVFLESGSLEDNLAFEPTEPAGIIYYPAEQDGKNKIFNKALVSKGPVPIVFIAHGNADSGIDSYKGFEYLQKKLAQIGIISVSINFNKFATAGNSIQNIEERADHLIYIIFKFIVYNGNPNSIFYDKINFHLVGLIGHSRGGEAVILSAEVLKDMVFLPDPQGIKVEIKGVVSLAPTNVTNIETIKNYDFMTILPAKDGDVYRNYGAIFYDIAKPKNFKCQIFARDHVHNLFNDNWSSELQFLSTSRESHKIILSVYGIAFFRAVLQRHNTLNFLTQHTIPKNVSHDKIDISFEYDDSLVVDNHEDNNTISFNSLNLPTDSNIPVNELLLDYDNIEFVNTFIGRSNGMILELDLGVFRTELHNNTNISDKEIWIRVAEIYINDSYIGGDINFDLGLEDNNGRIVWINSGEVGSIPPPTNSYGYPHPPYNIINNKSVFRTLRFPAFCFSSKDHFLNLNNIRFIMIRSKLDPKIFSGRKLALDDLQIVKVKMGLSIIDDLPIVTEVKKN